MSKQPLRGSKESIIGSIAEALRLAIKASNDHEDLKRLVRIVVKECEKELNQFKKPKP